MLRILKAGGTSVDAGMLQQVQELCVGVTIKIKQATKQLVTRVLLPTNDSGAHALQVAPHFFDPFWKRQVRRQFSAHRRCETVPPKYKSWQHMYKVQVRVCGCRRVCCSATVVRARSQAGATTQKLTKERDKRNRKVGKVANKMRTQHIAGTLLRRTLCFVHVGGPHLWW